MRKAIIPAVLLILALYLTSRAACANKEFIPFFGKWSGSFVVDSVRSGADTPQERKRFGLQGYVMIYATNRSFLLHLEGEQEVIDVKGNWMAKGHRVMLKTTEVKIDDFGGEENRDPNKKFIPATAVQDAYAHPLVLDLSADKKRYMGQRISMGNLIGHHEFVKDSF